MKIAVIGLIGSGKSSVMDYLRQQEYNVFDCDVISKEVMARDDVKEQISKEYNISIIDGELNKNQLSKIIFSDCPEKEALENYIHKLVLEKLEEIAKGYTDIYVEVSAFKDSVVANFFDVILGVVCDKETRVQRIIKRNGFSKKKIESIMAVQPTEEEIRKISNYVIENNNNLEDMQAQVERFLDFVYAGVGETFN